MTDRGPGPYVFEFEFSSPAARAAIEWPEVVRDLMIEACLRVAPDPWAAPIYREDGDPRSRILPFGGAGWVRFWIDEKERRCLVTGVGWMG